MAQLILGPLLRYVGEDRAVIWVETDAPCEVEALGASARTFEVEGHHYGLVGATGLSPATEYDYEVDLDGQSAWPEPDSPYPPSRFRTLGSQEPLDIAFGSCRVAAPHDEPWALPKELDERGRGADALRLIARRMITDPGTRPDLLLLVGDQVYADEPGPETKAAIGSDLVVDFEDYTVLYREAWSDPTIRWLLSTVPSAMIFDDHDVHDDWNISESWVEDMREQKWWREHIIGALMSYWVYQHLGNLGPDEQDEDKLYRQVREHDGDAGPLLREFARRADSEPAGTRWSYHRDLDGTRLVVVDSRAGRMLKPGERSMLDPDEWDWLEEYAVGGFDHLLIATSLPWLLSPAMHDFEAASEAICDGAWGSFAARLGEKVRRGVDLEHWAAFEESFRRLAEIQQRVGAGERGEPPATIVTLSGDVHHAYLSEVGFRRGSGVQSGVYQAVCSPMRNPLNLRERNVIRFMTTRAADIAARLLRRAAGVPDPPVRWRGVGDGPFFDNQVASLKIAGRSLEFTIEKAIADSDGGARLERSFQRKLA